MNACTVYILAHSMERKYKWVSECDASMLNDAQLFLKIPFNSILCGTVIVAIQRLY